MSEVVARGRPTWRAGPGVRAEAERGAPDGRRVLQLALAGIWLLDGVLQYQSFMFSKAFGQMLAGTAAGNPGVVARPILWDAGLIARHGVLLNTIFATIQLLIGIGIAWRPTVRVALGASIVWAAGVWWFGEGLGMVLTGGASPVNGAPGAVILYGLLAVLLWPADRDRDGRVVIPGWILGIFAAVMLVVAVVSATRLAAARPWRQPGLADIDLAHLLMATAMAGMLARSLRTLPDGVWAVIFGLMTAWFGSRVARDARACGVRAAGGRCTPHLLHAAAMLYMFLAFATPAGRPVTGGMSGMGGLDVPFLAVLSGLALIGYTVRDLDQLPGPRVVTGCRIAMGITMSFMLLIMV